LVDVRKLFKYGLAVVRDRKLLVVREHGTLKFLLPGGKPENGEGLEEALSREVKEELDANIKLGSVKFYGIFEDVAANEPDTVIQISLSLGEVEGDLKPSSEIEEIAWIGGDHKVVLAPSIQNKILPALIRDGIVD
jgi:8-oxo-dGTP diphosphatase